MVTNRSLSGRTANEPLLPEAPPASTALKNMADEGWVTLIWPSQMPSTKSAVVGTRAIFVLAGTAIPERVTEVLKFVTVVLSARLAVRRTSKGILTTCDGGISAHS